MAFPSQSSIIKITYLFFISVFSCTAGYLYFWPGRIISGAFNMIKILSLSFIIFLFPIYYSIAQDIPTYDYAAPNVKSIWFEKEGWSLSYPVIQLKTTEQIVLFFDLLDNRAGSLSYTFIHCDRDWNRSDLFTSDFIEGMEENRMYDYVASFNTLVSYTHYTLRIPNDDVSFKISGNYVVVISDPSDPDRPLLTRRFFVHERSTSAAVSFYRPMKPGTTDTHQQPEITVATGGLSVPDPYRQVTLTIMQNGRWDRAKHNLKPDVVGAGKLGFSSLSENTLMPGGNEFRYFDIKTVKQTRQNVRAIGFVNGHNHAFLIPSLDREFRQYFFDEDLNGKYIIAMEESDEPGTDADYVYVYFTLPVLREAEGGSVYVAGAFTDWAYGPGNRMTFNPLKGSYEATFLLKQGWYNYEYAFVPDGSLLPEGASYEGSHYQTENDYLILTYFRDPRQRYDRLTDASVFNSRGLR